jgi:hypothetical protein
MNYLSMYRGDDRTLTITTTEDLSGSDIRFTARSRHGAPEPAILKQTGAGISLDEEGSSAVVTLDAADTADLDPCALVWDIQVVDGAGKTHTVATGWLVVLGDVTDPAPVGS